MRKLIGILLLLCAIVSPLALPAYAQEDVNTEQEIRIAQDPMNVTNIVLPANSQGIFSDLGPDEPFVMVNLLEFKENAEYSDDRESSLTGEEAYRLYLSELKDLLEENGGRFVKYSPIFGLLFGEVDDLWDYILVVEYPSVVVFGKLTSSQEFREAQMHRIAGLAGQLNIATKGDSMDLSLLE